MIESPPTALSREAPRAFVSVGRGLNGAARFGLFAASLACLALLIVAWKLEPSASGMGTHKQLGLPACNFLSLTGAPCPTCGMTTSFALVTQGQPAKAFLNQPFGATACVTTACVFWICLYGALSGARVDIVIMWLLRPRVLWTGLAFLLASWAYKALTTGV